MRKYKGFKISVRRNAAVIKGDGVTIKKITGSNRGDAKRKAKRYIDRRKVI